MSVNNSEAVMSHNTNEMNSSCIQCNCDYLKLINAPGNKCTIKSTSGSNPRELTNVCYMSMYIRKKTFLHIIFFNTDRWWLLQSQQWRRMFQETILLHVHGVFLLKYSVGRAKCVQYFRKYKSKSVKKHSISQWWSASRSVFASWSHICFTVMRWISLIVDHN